MLALVVLAVSLASALAQEQCQRYEISDRFEQGLNASTWFLASGKASDVAPAQGGGIVSSMSATNMNQVIMSTLSFGPGTKVKMVATGSNAIGAVSTLCFYNGDTGHDEVDLELVAKCVDHLACEHHQHAHSAKNQLMVPIWKGAGAAGANRVGLSNPPPSDDWRQFANLQSGAQLDISEPWTPGTAYTVVTPDFSLATQHEYELDWQTDHISVSVDGSLVAKYTRDKSAAWPEEFLPLNIGLWTMIGEGFAAWAGAIDFVKTPKPSYTINSIEISGCAIINSKGPGTNQLPVGVAPPAPSSSLVTVSDSAGSASLSASLIPTSSAPASVVDATSSIVPPGAGIIPTSLVPAPFPAPASSSVEVKPPVAGPTDSPDDDNQEEGKGEGDKEGGENEGIMVTFTRTLSRSPSRPSSSVVPLPNSGGSLLQGSSFALVVIGVLATMMM